jgi:hypothetical protein
MEILLSIFVLLVIFDVILWVRNNTVYEAKMQLLKETSAAAETDIYAERDWEWRYSELDKVSYLKMVAHFWRDPRSMYENLDFVDPYKAREN